MDKKPTADRIVYETRTGVAYHGANCPKLHEDSSPISISEAKAKGLQECGSCLQHGRL